MRVSVRSSAELLNGNQNKGCSAVCTLYPVSGVRCAVWIEVSGIAVAFAVIQTYLFQFRNPIGCQYVKTAYHGCAMGMDSLRALLSRKDNNGLSFLTTYRRKCGILLVTAPLAMIVC